MGRKRKKGNEKLPPYVYLAKGRYVHRPYQGGILGKEKRLIDGGASLAEVWAACEKLTGKETDTLRWLLSEFLKSDYFINGLSPRTQKDYERYYLTIIDSPLRSGQKFGDVPLTKITPGSIRKYLDRRGQDAPVQANREKSLISSAWSWGRERDMCGDNPCLGVRKNAERPRDRYVTDEEYGKVYALAEQFSPPYITVAMEIAFLCRARMKEVLSLTRDHITDEGLIIERLKKSKTQIIEWSPRLRAAVEAAKKLPGISWQRWLVHGNSGKKIIESTFKTSWQRLLVRTEKMGVERFTFHDLKAKGISDFDGDKKKAAGHRSDRMVDIYDRLPGKIKATK